MTHYDPSKPTDLQGFARAYGTYNRYRKTLKRIYHETLELYMGAPCGIKAREYLDLEHKKLTTNEENLLQNTIHNPLSVVIMGQTYKAKCQFVNMLFGQDILPVKSASWLKHGKMIKFKYGTRPQVSMSLQDSFIIIEPRLHTSTFEENVNWAQEFSLLEEDLDKIEGGTVEITLHHPILRGSQVILCSGDGGLSDVLFEEKAESFQLLPSSCTLGTSPVFIYSVEKEHLCTNELENLACFRTQYVDCAVMFCSVSDISCTKEIKNQPPMIADSVNGLNETWFCENCHQEHSSGSCQLHPGKARANDAKCTALTTRPMISEGTDVRRSPNDHDFCNNKLNRTFQEMVASPGCCGEKAKGAKRMSQPKLPLMSETCIHHGKVGRCCQELIKELFRLGFQFCCNCKGQYAPPNPIYDDVDNEYHDWDSSSEETETIDSCFQSNPSYTSLNTSVLEDLRMKSFPPSSVYLSCQIHRDKVQARVLSFLRSVAKYYLIRAAKVLHRLHSGILDNSIRYAFQMSRDLMITPRRMEYARQQEHQLFEQLVEISNKKQSEMQELISGIKSELRENILNAAESYDIPDEEGTFRQVSVIKKEIQDLVLRHIKTSTAERLYDSIRVLRESYIGTLSRCLECLESSVEESSSHKDSQGTTTKHFKKIVHAAYNVELNIQSSSSLARIMIDKLRQLLSNLPWHEPPIMDRAWRRNVASDVLASLDDSRLAKSICSQFRTRLQQSHSAFLTSLRNLESTHTCRLEHTEENRHKVAKIVAPHVASLALESTSMIDSVLYGMPKMGREIGRGMYGVVYQCDNWASWSPCAIKSVAPPDEKHANDLSLEFYYTRSLPEHPRVVQIRGSIVDESYAGGMGPPAVLLIMDRLHCDLYTSIKRGMSECSRMQVAVDVVEGIRFLHGQGLIHRDIKLKNVLLDRKMRAKITDLGFCKPGAMISGSIVGTPVHMPPELFSGKYDNSVDVYAFGVLLWYLCAGVTRLPRNFETCSTKDHLWTAVRKGVRPERLPVFTDECWNLMKACWHSDPTKRPLLGKIQPMLIDILSRLQC